jgi:UDP-glucose 4-epimerase
VINHDNDQRTVLITGAAGLIGVPVVRRFCGQGYRVVAVDDGSAGTLSRFNEFSPDADVAVRILDIRHRIELERLLATERPWAVIHLAARHFIPDCERSPDLTLEVNVLGTQRLVDACAAHPPQRLVFASTADVYAASTSPHAEDDPVAPQGVYGCSKLLGEWLLRDQAHRLPGCVITVARLFNVYGSGDPHPHLLPEVIRQARHGTTLRLGDVESARDFVYAEDAAEALVALTSTAHPGVVNIGTGTAVLGRELVTLVAEATGRLLEIHLDHHRLRRHSRPVSCAVPNRLRGLLPWWPRTSLREGIARTTSAELSDTTDEYESRAS